MTTTTNLKGNTMTDYPSGRSIDEIRADLATARQAAHANLNDQIADTDIEWAGITEETLHAIVDLMRRNIDHNNPHDQYGPNQLHAAINAYVYSSHVPGHENMTVAQRVIEGGHWYVRHDADDDADMVETVKVIYAITIGSRH